MSYKYKTKAVMHSKVFKPNSKSIALSHASLKEQGQVILPQSDLLYVRSVLVTAGMNANDDVFYNRELWNARFSPILKPLNWQHKDEEIVGVMYNVMARDIETDELIPMDRETFDKPFELITEGVVYKLLFPNRAAEIVDKSSADELFVSMEVWFNDYDYSVFKDGRMDRVIKRNAETAFLDEKLRVYKGDGVFDFGDGDSGRIGRGLIDLNFGGCGFVEHPANDRSFIESVGDDPKNSDADVINNRLLRLLDVLEAKDESVINKKEVAMEGEKKVIAEAVQDAINDHDAKKAAEHEMAKLREKAEKAEALEAEVTSMRSAFNTINQNLGNLLGKFTDTMKVVTKTLAKGEVPAEIKKIDNADTGEEAFQAKIAWIEQSMAFIFDGVTELSEKAAKVDEMQKNLDEVAWAGKSDKVTALLGEHLSTEDLDNMLVAVKKLADSEFNEWYSEKEMLVASIAPEEEATEAKKKMDEEEEKEDEGKCKEKAKSDVDADEDAEDKDTAEAEKVLDDVVVEDKPNVSNATSEEETDPQGMKKVVAAIYESPKKQESDEDKPGFDPVK